MMASMVASRASRGRERGRWLRNQTGSELRLAQIGAGLTLAFVAAAVGTSIAELSRIERGLAEWVTVDALSRISAVVGLELSLRAYPSGVPIRDSIHAGVTSAFRALLPIGCRVASEVPIGPPGDQGVGPVARDPWS